MKKISIKMKIKKQFLSGVMLHAWHLFKSRKANTFAHALCKSWAVNKQKFNWKQTVIF